MADKKISALTAATTPLAGTEVLPIVQGASTVKVSAANITAGRDVSAKTLTGESAGAGAVTEIFARNTAGPERVQIISRNTAGVSYVQTQNSQMLIGSFDNFAVQFMVNNSSKVVLETNSDVKVSTGNLVMSTAGKGIDFSANGGDVLSQYDEGTWNVVWTNLTGTPANLVGYYTRIGRVVYFTYSAGGNSVTATAASTRFSLPFTPLIEASGTQISQNVTFSGTTLILPSNSSCYVGTFTTSFMVFSGSYII